MKGSDKNTRDGRVRVSYVDDAEIIERIEEMAKKRRLTCRAIRLRSEFGQIYNYTNYYGATTYHERADQAHTRD